MVVKVYVSGISGNKEVKKRQQRVLMILDSRIIKYEVVDIAEPGNEDQKDFMQNNSKSMGATVSDTNPRHPLPPQIYNDDIYCGDYDQFDLANEIDELEKFLKLAPDDTAPIVTSNAEIKLDNGEVESASKNSENEGTQEVVNSTEATEAIPENNVAVEKEEAAQTETELIEQSNDDAKAENGSGEKESVTVDES